MQSLFLMKASRLSTSKKVLKTIHKDVRIAAKQRNSKKATTAEIEARVTATDGKLIFKKEPASARFFFLSCN